MTVAHPNLGKRSTYFIAKTYEELMKRKDKKPLDWDEILEIYRNMEENGVKFAEPKKKYEEENMKKLFCEKDEEPLPKTDKPYFDIYKKQLERFREEKRSRKFKYWHKLKELEYKEPPPESKTFTVKWYDHKLNKWTEPYLQEVKCNKKEEKMKENHPEIYEKILDFSNKLVALKGHAKNIALTEREIMLISRLTDSRTQENLKVKYESSGEQCYQLFDELVRAYSDALLGKKDGKEKEGA